MSSCWFASKQMSSFGYQNYQQYTSSRRSRYSCFRNSKCPPHSEIKRKGEFAWQTKSNYTALSYSHHEQMNDDVTSQLTFRGNNGWQRLTNQVLALQLGQRQSMLTYQSIRQRFLWAATTQKHYVQPHFNPKLDWAARFLRLLSSLNHNAGQLRKSRK